MKSILFDSEGATNLNKLVQAQIAPHLFIICNYNPNTFYLLSDDAKFNQGVLNLYKFSIDTSLINKISQIDSDLWGVMRNKHGKELSELKGYLDTISLLRSFLAHNNNNNEIISRAESWARKVIHKKDFETIGDYTVALKELENIGRNLFTVVDSIIKCMVKEYPKKDLQAILEDYIVRFYESNDKLIKEVLCSTYQLQRNCRGDVKENLLANWCREMYVGAREKKINNLKQFLVKAKGDSAQKIQALIEQTEKEIDEIQAKVADKFCRGNKSNLCSYDYLNYYCYDFGNKCWTKLPEIIKRNYTMLPEDMVQYIVAEDFNNVQIVEV